MARRKVVIGIMRALDVDEMTWVPKTKKINHHARKSLVPRKFSYRTVGKGITIKRLE